jgi:hypothetical protein
MSNDEGSPNAQMTKERRAFLLNHSGFRHSFDIRHSGFVILSGFRLSIFHLAWRRDEV